ncbi:MAG TPA: glycosyltransferase family 2 protein [Solirubrobacteraceae bacterium]|nr:glycosyltransferase family 2 protein [Solirubrobacteraceae bacterium]
MPVAVRAAKIAFWASAGLLVYTHVGYAGVLAALARRRPAPAADEREPTTDPPSVSVIVAAYAEQDVIADRVANLRELDYPADRVQVIVACDGSSDETASRARAAGADLVLELPRAGKVRAQDAAVQRSDAEIVAFSDANVRWEHDALARLVAPFADPQVGYVCGDVRFLNEFGDNQEGVYWRYEMALRSLESRVRSVTGGNGAIYATRRRSYIVVDAIMGHDLSFPFNMVKRGWRAVYAPDARAWEKMVPTIEGEFDRKRRMMSHGWPIVLTGGMLSPRGYDPLYALMIVSHRLLRYGSPFLHAAALAANVALLGAGRVYRLALAAQLGLVAAALAAPAVRLRPLLVARYYALTTASLAAGLLDWLHEGTSAGWEAAPGTR